MHISIDIDLIEADDRFGNLVALLNINDRVQAKMYALGLMARFRMEALLCWKKNHRLISVKEVQAEGFGPILTAGFAKLRKKGVCTTFY